MSASSASVTDPNSSQSEAPTKKPKKKRKVSNFQGKLVIQLYCTKKTDKTRELYPVVYDYKRKDTDDNRFNQRERIRIKRYLTE